MMFFFLEVILAGSVVYVVAAATLRAVRGIYEEIQRGRKYPWQ